jgi:hypothetical protein
MTNVANTPASGMSKIVIGLQVVHDNTVGVKEVAVLREQYKCPHFRILVMGRANAGKTTILEKICHVAKGTKPIIFDKNGKLAQDYNYFSSYMLLGEKLTPDETHVTPSLDVSKISEYGMFTDVH